MLVVSFDETAGLCIDGGNILKGQALTDWRAAPRRDV
jgi:hypothetical protein